MRPFWCARRAAEGGEYGPLERGARPERPLERGVRLGLTDWRHAAMVRGERPPRI